MCVDALKGEALAAVQSYGFVVDKDILETVLLKVLVLVPRQDLKLVHAYLRLLQQTVKSEDLLVVAQEGFEIRSKILGCAGLIAAGSFVSALLRCFDVNPTAVAEEREAYRSA